MGEIDNYDELDEIRVEYLIPLRAYFKADSDKEEKFNELTRVFNNVYALLLSEECDIPFNYDDLMVLQAIETIIKHKYEPRRAEIEYYQTLKSMYTYA